MSWTLEARVSADLDHDVLVDPQETCENFAELPFSGSSLFRSKAVGVSSVAACIFDDATLMKRNRFAAAARRGMLFCLDSEQLIVDRLPLDCDADVFLSISLAGVAEQVDLKAQVDQESIEISSADDGFVRGIERLGELPPWRDCDFSLPDAPAWSDVERVVFEVLKPFIGVNYLQFRGEEPVYQVFRVARPGLRWWA